MKKVMVLCNLSQEIENKAHEKTFAEVDVKAIAQIDIRLNMYKNNFTGFKNIIYVNPQWVC